MAKVAVLDFTASLEKGFKPEVKAFKGNLSELIGAARTIAATQLAKQAKATMQGWLNPNSNTSVGIGWSGKSARGLSVVTGGDGSAQVIERNAVLGVIRHGLAPHASGPHVSMDKFKEWMRDRNIDRTPEQKKTKKRDSAKQVIERAWRIRSSIRKYGTSKWWLNNVPATEGHRFFNYPKRYQDDYARQLGEGLIHKLLMGQGPGGFRALISSFVISALSSATSKDKVHSVTYFRGSVGYKNIMWQDAQMVIDDVQHKIDEANR